VINHISTQKKNCRIVETRFIASIKMIKRVSYLTPNKKAPN